MSLTREEAVTYLTDRIEGLTGTSRDKAEAVLDLVADGLETYFGEKKGRKIAKKLRGE